MSIKNVLKKRSASNAAPITNESITPSEDILVEEFEDEKLTIEKPSGKALSTNALTGFIHQFEDGICESSWGKYCLTGEFDDVNYEDERPEIKSRIYDLYAQLYAYFPPRSRYMINLVDLLKKDIQAERYLPEVGDTAELAAEYNDELMRKQQESRSNFERKKYFTFGVDSSSVEEARVTLSTMREGVSRNFKRIGTKMRILDGQQRMKLMHDLIRGVNEPFFFSYDRIKNTRKEHARDFVAPSWAAYDPQDKLQSSFAMPGHIQKTFHIRDFGSDLSDRAIGRIRDLPIPKNIALIFCPQVKSKTIQRIRQNINAAQAEIFSYQASVAKQNGDITVLPPSLEEKEAEARELLDFMIEKDQLMNNFAGYITVYATSYDELKVYERALKDEAQTWSIDIADLPWQQEEAFPSALPLADPRLKKKFRTLTTAESAVMIPWSSQNIQHDPKRSYYLGQDKVSNGLIFADPSKCLSPHMWIFGITGAGKGMTVKALISYLVLQNMVAIIAANKAMAEGTKMPVDLPPEIHSIDFHGEYGEVIVPLGGETTKISPVYDNAFNPLDISNEAGKLTSRAIAKNNDYFLAIMSDVLGRSMTRQEESMLDRCLRAVYKPYVGKVERPVLKDLYTQLKKEKHENAQQLAEALEMFVEGTMNTFNAQTNIPHNMWANNYDCSELGETMRTFALLTIMQHIKQRVYANHKIGRQTLLLVEETQVVFGNEPAVRVLDSFFGELRKFGLRLICVTQQPKRVLNHPQAQHLFDNSGMFVFLANSPENVAKISEMFSLSEEQSNNMSLTNDPGDGLVIINGVKISMKNTFKEGTKIYELWNTDEDKLLKKAQAEEERVA